MGFVKLRVVKLTKDNKITCGHQYPKDVYWKQDVKDERADQLSRF